MIKLVCLEFHVEQWVNDVLLDAEIIYGHMYLRYHATQAHPLHFTELFEGRGHALQWCPGLARSARKIMPFDDHGPFQPCSPSPCACAHAHTLPSSCPTPTSSSLLKGYAKVFGVYFVDESLSAGPTVLGPFHISRSSNVFRQTACRKFRSYLYFVLSKLNRHGGKPRNSLPAIHQQIYETVTCLIFVFSQRAFCEELFPIIPLW